VSDLSSSTYKKYHFSFSTKLRMTCLRSPPEGQRIALQGGRFILLLEDGRIAKMGESILRQEVDNLNFG
jgi:hypothetical protein